MPEFCVAISSCGIWLRVAGVSRFRLLGVGLTHLAVAEADVGQVQGLLLALDVLARDPQALLVGPDVDVGAGDLRRQADQGLVIVLPPTP